LDKSKDEVRKFLKRVKKEFDPDLVILFGSRARGDAWKRSDYDFIVVSKQFEGVHWLARIEKVVRLWDSVISIDLLPYTPEEFSDKKQQSSFVRKAVREGRVLAEA
jgi:hypothetical protein